MGQGTECVYLGVREVEKVGLHEVRQEKSKLS